MSHDREAVARAKALASDVLEPRADALDEAGGFPRDSLRQLAHAGLLSITVSEALGGLGATTVGYARSVAVLAQACAATTVALCVSNMVAEVIATFGDEAQIHHWVPRLSDGSMVVGAFALSEPGAGSDPASLQTRARRTDQGWSLSGSKMWITSGTDAGVFIVWARTSDALGARGLSCFLVSGDAPGLVRGRPEDKLGLHGSTTTTLSFDDVEVGSEARLGPEGAGFRIAMMALDGGRIGIAAQALGIAEAALEYALSQVGSQRNRHARALAESRMEIDASRLLVERAAARKAQGQPLTKEASMAKLYASETAQRVCDRMLGVLGPEALLRTGRWSRYLRDAKVTTIYEGTSEIQRLVLSRALIHRD